MKFKVKDMDITTGDVIIAIVNEKDAKQLELYPGDRVVIQKGRKKSIAIVDIAESEKAVPQGQIGMFEELLKRLCVKDGQNVELNFAKQPESIKHIKKKLQGNSLNKEEIYHIVEDIVNNELTAVEITYFVSANYTQGMSKKEIVHLTRAMIETGDVIKFNKKIVVDKHCIGGVPGNRTTMIVIPIIAAAGITIPKTSSRSITSPAGTADTMEAITNVSLNKKQIIKTVNKTNGCLVWGGALNLAPADDIIIKVEHPLKVDPEGQLLASILAKKGSVCASHVLIDIPVGRGAKISDKKEARRLGKEFISLGKMLGMKIKVVITDGSEPIGNGIGPSLEARDVMWLLQGEINAPLDLREKSLVMAGMILEMCGKCKKGKGYLIAEGILNSGEAYSKMLDIIKMQGGKREVKIRIGKYKHDVKCNKNGKINHIDNKSIARIAFSAGAPVDKEAGIYLYKHKGDKVNKGDTLFTIYADNKKKLEFAKSMLKEVKPYEIK